MKLTAMVCVLFVRLFPEMCGMPCASRKYDLQRHEKEDKGGWRMPRLTEAMKDVISCDKRGVGANIL